MKTKRMTKKAMTKDEILSFLGLISEYAVLTSKSTNATANKLKEEAWVSLTDAFNTNYARFPKQIEQLKFKWKNLKKAARKRKHLARLNRLKADGEVEYIPRDEVLEKVECLMGGSSCSGLPVPSIDDGLPTTVTPEISIVSIKVEECADDKFKNSSDETSLDGHNEERILSISPTPQVEKEVEIGTKFLYRMPIPIQNKGKTKWPNDGRREKNLAIAKYFEKKSEKIDLEITLLKMEIESMKKNQY